MQTFLKDGSGGGPTGIVGRVIDVVGTIEYQDRGTPHLHSLVWVDGMPDPTDLRHMLKHEPATRALFLAYLDNLISCDRNWGSELDEDAKKAAEERKEPVIPVDGGESKAVREPLLPQPKKRQRAPKGLPPTRQSKRGKTAVVQEQTSEEENKTEPVVVEEKDEIAGVPVPITTVQLPLLHPCSRRPPDASPEVSQIQYATGLGKHVRDLVEQCQVHRHTGTCFKKGQIKRKSAAPQPVVVDPVDEAKEHKSEVAPVETKAPMVDQEKETKVGELLCRMRFPRELVKESHVSEPELEIRLKREDQWINNFNPYILAGIQANNDIVLIIGGKQSNAFGHYLTKYLTKPAGSATNLYAVIADAVGSGGATGEPPKSSAEPNQPVAPLSDAEASEKGRRLVIRCATKMASLSQKSLPEITALCLDLDEHYMRHEYDTLYLPAFFNWIDAKEEDSDDDEEETKGERETKEYGLGLGEEKRTEPLQQVNPDSAGDETLRIAVDDDGRPFMLSPRLDYLHRSDETDLDQTCLYEFVRHFHRTTAAPRKAKKAAKTPSNPRVDVDQDEEPEPVEEVKRGRQAAKRFQFIGGHDPIHALKRRPVPVIPNIFGVAWPNRTTQPEAFCRIAMVLFCPFRRRSDLRQPGESWEHAFEAWLETPDLPDWLETRLDYMESIRDGIDARDQEIDRKRREEKEAAARSSANGDSKRGDVPEEDEPEPETDTMGINPAFEPITQYTPGEVTNILDTADMIQLGEESEDGQPQQSTYLRRTLQSLRAGGLLQTVAPARQPNTASSSTSTSTSWIEDGQPGDTDRKQLTSWLSDLKQQPTRAERERVEAEAQRSAASSSGTTVAEVDEKESKAPPATTITTEPVLATAERIIRDAGLNTKQQLGFHLVVQQLEKELAIPEEKDRRVALQTGALEPRRIYVAGVAGTGKTRLINAIRQLFKEHGRGDWLQTCANMGLAAFLIGGRTVASLIGARGSPEEVEGVGKEQRGIADSAGRSRTAAKQTKATTERLELLRRIRFLVVDEISMIGCNSLNSIHEALVTARSTKTDRTFADVTMLFIGDLSQLPAIMDLPLCTQLARPVVQEVKTRRLSAGRPSAKEAAEERRLAAEAKRSQLLLSDPRKMAAAMGRLHWTQLTDVVFLDQQMRQSDDPTFSNFLNDLRVGRGGRHHQYLQQVSLGTADCLKAKNEIRGKSEWLDATFITPRNIIKDEYNKQKAIHLAATTNGGCVLVVPAFDRITDPNRAERETQKQRGQATARTRGEGGEAPKKQGRTAPAKRGRPPKARAPLMPTRNEAKELMTLGGAAGGSMQGVLWLVVGMPLILKRNIDQPHGICTGVRATLVSVQLAEGDQCIVPDPIKAPHIKWTTKQPTHIIVHVDDPQFLPLPGLNSGEFPIDMFSASFKYRFGGPHSPAPQVNITRRQFPIDAAWAITTHSSQGQTIARCVIDCEPPPGLPQPLSSIYVAWSRVKGMEFIRALSRFSERDLSAQPPLALVAEYKELYRKAAITEQRAIQGGWKPITLPTAVPVPQPIPAPLVQPQPQAQPTTVVMAQLQTPQIRKTLTVDGSVAPTTVIQFLETPKIAPPQQLFGPAAPKPQTIAPPQPPLFAQLLPVGPLPKPPPPPRYRVGLVNVSDKSLSMDQKYREEVEREQRAPINRPPEPQRPASPPPRAERHSRPNCLRCAASLLQCADCSGQYRK